MVPKRRESLSVSQSEGCMDKSSWPVTTLAAVPCWDLSKRRPWMPSTSHQLFSVLAHSILCFSGHSANKHLCHHTEESSASSSLRASQLFLSHLQWKPETSYTKKQWNFNFTHSWSEFPCSQAPNPVSCWDSDTLPPATQYPGPGLCVTRRRQDLRGSKDAASTSHAGKQPVSGKAGRSEQCQSGRAHKTLSRDSGGNGTSNYKVTMENNVPRSTCKSWLSRKQLIIWATLIFSSG